MTEEIWKPMKYHPEYVVSNFGNIKHLARDTSYKRKGKTYIRHYDEHQLSTRMVEYYYRDCPTGQFFKEVRINGGCGISVAEEVLSAFTDKVIYFSDKIIYKDGNPENCHLENLDYDESSNNHLR